MNNKEKFINLIKGEKSTDVLIYRDVVEWYFPGFTTIPTEKGFKDLLGVSCIINEYGPTPDTSNCILEDISLWRDTICLPDLETIDWEAVSASDLKKHDPEKIIDVMPSCAFGGTFFIPLINMMGFENALIALYDDPDSCKELFSYICDYNISMIPYLEKYYNPDMYSVGDDFASSSSLFISHDIFDDVFKPSFERLFSALKQTGKIIEWHCCGKCESLVKDFVEMGVDIWQPAQAMNDLENLMATYGDRIVFEGGWQGSGAAEMSKAPEDVVRKSVRDTIDRCAPKSRYVFWDGDPVGVSEDSVNKFRWVMEEALEYGKNYYSK